MQALQSGRYLFQFVYLFDLSNSQFVDDTKLGKSLHEKTPKHQRAVQEQIQHLHSDNEKRKLVAKEELAALKRIRKEIGQTSESNPGLDSNLGKATAKPLVLSAKIAEVDSSKIIDPTPQHKKQKNTIRRSHEFSTFQLTDKDSDNVGRSVVSDNLVFGQPETGSTTAKNKPVKDEPTNSTEMKQDSKSISDTEISSGTDIASIKAESDFKLDLEEHETKPKGNLFKKRRVNPK